jgi:hypothetical protein
MTPDPEDDALLKELFQQTSPDLPDNGFSRRVMQALPSPVGPSPWLLGSLEGMAGLALALLVLALSSDSAATSEKALVWGRLLLSAFATPMVGLAMGSTLLSLAISYAFVRWQTH